MSYLYVVESADFISLKNQTGLTCGNMTSHITKLEDAGYVNVEKKFKGKKPHTMLSLTETGRTALREYRQSIRKVLNEIPD